MQNSSALIKRVTGSRGTAGITMQEVIRSSVIARVVGGDTTEHPSGLETFELFQ